MKKEDYVKAFAGVGPREEALEKAMDVKNNGAVKKRRGFKAAISLLAAVLLLGALALTANAATNGHLYEGVKLLAAGEKLDLMDFIRHYEEYVDENGNYIRETVAVSADGKNKSWVRTEKRPDGGSGISFGLSIEPEGAPSDLTDAQASAEETTAP